jgi:hypothetical protein
MGVNGELKMMFMGPIVTYFKALYQNLFEGAEINHNNPYPRRDSNPLPPGMIFLQPRCSILCHVSKGVAEYVKRFLRVSFPQDGDQWSRSGRFTPKEVNSRIQ